jgi:AcrR family transcriptional regulator
MSITDRKLRQKEEVRASILDTAWEMVVTEGWQSFSIRKVADAIEYSVPVIYSHFENKDAILLEFNRKGFKLLAEALAKAKAGQEKPADQIRAMGRAYWNYAFANKEYYQLMFGLGIPTCDTASRIPALADFNEVIISSIEGMVAPGKQPSFNPWLKYQSFWSMLHGLVSINMVTPSRAEKPGQEQEHSGLPGEEMDDHEVTGEGKHDRSGLSQAVLEDVMCSFIRGIEASESATQEVRNAPQD